MSDTPARDAQGDVLILNRVPTSALQALYHAATGKTENLEKRLTKNFIVRKDDVTQLYFKIMQQLEHFERVAGPTITVKVSFHNHEHQQFSSWERFAIFDTGKSEIVSDIVIKFEFLIRLPEQQTPQRYVLNIDIDSKLPMILSIYQFSRHPQSFGSGRHLRRSFMAQRRPRVNQESLPRASLAG